MVQNIVSQDVDQADEISPDWKAFLKDLVNKFGDEPDKVSSDEVRP
jgi:hypothetical protein